MKTKEEIDLLVEENLQLVKFVINRKHQDIVRRVKYLNLYEDFYQEGCIGLYQAAKKFDESKGFKFSTYAVQQIDFSLRKFEQRYMAKHYHDEDLYLDKQLAKCIDDGITGKDSIYMYDEYNTDFKELKRFIKTSSVKDIEKIIDLLLQEKSKTYIGKLIGVSRISIQNRVEELKREYHIYLSLSQLVRINHISQVGNMVCN